MAKKKRPTGKISNTGRQYAIDKGYSKTGTSDKVRGLTDYDVTNLRIVEDYTDKVIEELDIAIARALEAIGIQAEGRAKGYCPVDTGRLRNSITHTIDTDEKAAIIGTNVEYGMYVELGTSRNDPQPYLVPAAQNHLDEYRKIFEKMMKS